MDKLLRSHADAIIRASITAVLPDEAVKRALDILNPIITIFLAVLVVFILLSVYLPIFSMYGSV